LKVGPYKVDGSSINCINNLLYDYVGEGPLEHLTLIFGDYNPKKRGVALGKGFFFKRKEKKRKDPSSRRLYSSKSTIAPSSLRFFFLLQMGLVFFFL
jgi:hypothetical protein